MDRYSEFEKLAGENGRAKTLCFTGHRSIPEKDMEILIKTTDALIEQSISEGYRIFLAGGAIGFDTLAAFRVLAAREKFDGVKLVLVLPCRNQTEKWTELKSLQEYQILKDNANAIIYTSDFYENGCMLKRNRFMVDNSSRVICYLTREKGGSAYTVAYARKKGIECINAYDPLNICG